jgi:hypothetical protein
MYDVARVVIKKLSQDEGYLHSRDVNYASQAGATCLRELAYWRLHPDKALPVNKRTRLLFEQGKWIERQAISQLEKTGYEIYERERPFEWLKFKLKGNIDGKIRVESKKRPLEIKGYPSWTWNKLNTIDDFLKSDLEYIRRVPAQLLSYLLMDAKSSWGLLYLLNKVTGVPKQIPLALEGKTLIWGEAMLKNLESVNRAVKRGILPKRINYAENVCGFCRFRHHCLVEIKPTIKGLYIPRGHKAEELLELLEARAKLQKKHKEYEEVDEEIGAIVKGRKKTVVGDWIINGQMVKVGRQVRKPYSFWRKSIMHRTKDND